MKTLEAIEDVLQAAMGLNPCSIGRHTVAQAIRRRMNACGEQSPEAYLARLHATPEEVQALLELVVVPETWFFRHPESFAVLVETIREEWVLHSPPKTLQILSAACSTGEEPYSIAMALIDAGFPRVRFAVEAIDISEAALARAQQGTWGNNSFRSLDVSFRDRYFVKTDQGFRLSEELRSAVRFRRANLAAAEFPEPGRIYDMIFCRNVLIYFDTAAQERAIASLDRALAPEGLLFVGPAEGFLAMSHGLRSTRQRMAFAFRKGVAASAGASPAVQARLPRRSAARKRLETRVKPAASIAAPIATQPLPDVSADLAEARRLADSGCLVEAQQICQGHLRGQSPSADAYYLMGLILDAMNNSQQACRYYRKALYLEPDNLEVLAHLALLQSKSGETTEAQRLRKRMERLQRTAPHCEVAAQEC